MKSKFSFADNNVCNILIEEQNFFSPQVEQSMIISNRLVIRDSSRVVKRVKT